MSFRENAQWPQTTKNVSALDKATNRSQHITIHASSGLSDDEVESMRKDAEAYADEDQARRGIVEARNTADNAIYAAEKMRREAGERISDQMRGEVGAKISDLRKAIEGEDVQVMRQATDDVMQATQDIAAAMQQPEPAAADPEEEPQAAGEDEEETDASANAGDDDKTEEPDSSPEEDAEED